jgi:membrane protease YdiL (CAAX protease family)
LIDLGQKQVLYNLCSNCQYEIPNGNKFCSKCGRAQNYKEVIIQSKKWPNIQQVGLFFLVEIVCCASVFFIDSPNLSTLYFFEGIMAISAIVFFGYNWTENKVILRWSGFSILKIIGLIVGTVLTSVVVTFLVSHLNRDILNKDLSYYSIFEFHKYGTYLMFACMALYPAIFEELAYRGYLMQKLLTVVDEKEAIYISSILFFIIHFSLLSIFWLLPFALFLGYLRVKTKTIWYGVIVHFFFNLTACFLDIFLLEDLFKMIS